MRKLIVLAAAALAIAGCRQGSTNQRESERTQRNATMNNPTPNPGAVTMPAAPAGQMPQVAQAGTPGQPSPMAAQANGTPAELYTPQLALDRLHAINLTEVQAGKLARDHGTQLVRQFADTLVNDHTAMDKEVQAVAEQLHVSLQEPSKVNWPAPVQQQMQGEKQKMDELQSKKGNDFDRQFLTMMIDGHTQALDYLKQLQGNAKEPQLKQLAINAAPKVQQHLTTAQDLVNRGGAKVQGRR